MEQEYVDASSPRGRLAMHETLELHELLAMQSNRLVQDKKTVAKVSDPTLRNIYLECIHATELQIKEIVHILNQRPTKRG